MTDTLTTLSTTDVEGIRNLLRRAQGNDLSCLTELRALLDSRPDLWKQVGDLGSHAEMATLRLVAGGNLHLFEAVQRKLSELKAQLAGEAPSALEQLIVDRIGVCWLQTHHLDLQATSASGSALTPQGVWAQKKLDSAQRRYLLAVKQLALVRKLLRPDLPSINVNAILASLVAEPNKQ
jgi:hypothetical protein